MEGSASFFNSILAGVCIGIGGTVFLSCDSRIAGALFFCVGLFTICTFGFNLFTGKVGYILENSPSYAGFLLLVWLGNLLGTAAVGYALRLTRAADVLAAKAASLCEAKLNDSLLSIFILSVFCNILPFYANKTDCELYNLVIYLKHLSKFSNVIQANKKNLDLRGEIFL